MLQQSTDVLPLRDDRDVVRVRQIVRDKTARLGFSLIDQTKVVTAASELARNTVLHGGGGTVTLESLRNDTRIGIRLCFEDHGPGIPDIELALRDGYTTKKGLGLGLSGSRRLMNEFEIESTPGVGTKVRVTRWK
jgi:serine/threonine-protein kinase RsbT